MTKRTCHFLYAAGCAECLQGKKQYFFTHALVTGIMQSFLTNALYCC